MTTQPGTKCGERRKYERKHTRRLVGLGAFNCLRQGPRFPCIHISTSGKFSLEFIICVRICRVTPLDKAGPYTRLTASGTSNSRHLLPFCPRLCSASAYAQRLHLPIDASAFCSHMHRIHQRLQKPASWRLGKWSLTA